MQLPRHAASLWQKVTMLAALPAIAALCVSCMDGGTPTAYGAEAAGASRLTSEVECRADIRGGVLLCVERSAGEAGGARHALYAGNEVKLTSSNISYDSASQVFAFDVNVRNLTSAPMGTTTGLDTTGFKVFYETGPVVSAYVAPGDTGTVSVLNADGFENFTGAHQPFHLYRRILAAGAVSPNQRWQLHCPPTVLSFSFTLRVFTRVPGEARVPMDIPDGYTISDDSLAVLYSPSRRVYQHPRGSGPYPRNVIIMGFVEGATADEMQAALDLVKARLIGGEGVFYHWVVDDDGTGNQLWHAIDRLIALPQVDYAGPDLGMMLIPLYAIPNDGPGWATADWQINPDSATGDNWGAEAIAAPLAWGCEPNGSGAQGADVDVEDLHSQQVASIMNNPGNDNAGITGIAWRGNVTRTDASRGGTAATPQQFADNAVRDLSAAVKTAAVINLSFGTGYRDSLHERAPVAGNQTDIMAARNNAYFIRRTVRRIETKTANRPLYVIAAGNYAMDAGFSGLPQLQADTSISSRVIVVAASDSAHSGHARSLWTNPGNSAVRGSNTGSLVEIAAPGASIQVMANGSVISAAGTSFAAPHVAAVAMLMKSFEPRLSADSLKILLLQGARNSGWTSGGFPFLSAYEALKLTAQRTGAPLCGNRLWTDSRRIMVQRGTGTETIVDLGGGISRDDIDPLHGGRRIRVNYTGQFGRDSTLTYTLQNHAWSQEGAGVHGWTVAVPGSSGTYLGTRRHRRSHNGDTLVTTSESNIAGAATLSLTLSWPGGTRSLPQLRRSQRRDDQRVLCLTRTGPGDTPGDSLAGCTSGTFYVPYSETGDGKPSTAPPGGRSSSPPPCAGASQPFRAGAFVPVPRVGPRASAGASRGSVTTSPRRSGW